MNGVMTSYNVRYFISDMSEKESTVMTTTDQEINITNLVPSTSYSIFVTASTQVAEGDRSKMMVVATGISKFFVR